MFSRRLVHAPQPLGRIFILAFGLAPASGRTGLVCGSESLGAGRARNSFVEGALSSIDQFILSSIVPSQAATCFSGISRYGVGFASQFLIAFCGRRGQGE